MSTDYADYRYRGSEHWNTKFAEYLLNVVRGLPGVESVCELGCGNGALARVLAEEGYRIEGVDGSESGIAMARRNSNDVMFHRDLIDGGIAGRLDKAHRFDLVLGSEVIEHLYRPSDFLEAALSLLRPSGWLVLTTPYHGYLKYFALAAAGRMDRHLNPNWDGGHIKFFTVRSLRELLRKHHFLVRDCLFFGRIPGFWKSMIVVAAISEKQKT